MKESFDRFASGYGMVFVLLLLCAYFSWATYSEQHLTGEDAAIQIEKEIAPQKKVLIVGRNAPEDIAFVDTLSKRVTVVDKVNGEPSDLRAVLQRLNDGNSTIDVVAVTAGAANWSLLENVNQKFPSLGSPKIVVPASYRWPSFLNGGNLLNIANQIAVIAIIAIGMTLVILTAGIDLSVGSLIALSAVVAAYLIRANGAENASVATMFFSCVAAIAICGILGGLSGLLITKLTIPPFITTLATMLVAKGGVELISENQSISDVPESFIWLGRGTTLGGIPNSVLLMLVLYACAHVVMTRMSYGRYVYAVGGNMEAARLSGVPIKLVVISVYVICGCLAGLGGVIQASLLKSGAPTYGVMYELYVIAAVVVGGTSLTGGEGKVLGTLIGAFIIAVINNGMNLIGLDSSMQKVVLGLVIAGAVIVDKIKKHGFNFLRR